jgi:magnesium-transporting ATPase (P-type)
MSIAEDDLKTLPLPEEEKKLGPSPDGLTSGEARHQLKKCGPNTMPDTSVHPLRVALEKFWAPVPWMLEAAILLELVLGKYVEAVIIAGLLVFNAALGLFQESRAQATLAALKSRLALNASVRRDGAWKTVPAAELVPGDLVKLSLGGVVAADVKLTGGDLPSYSTNPCSPANRCLSMPARAPRHSLERWYVGAKQWRRSRRPERAPSSAVPRNSSAPPMS